MDRAHVAESNALLEFRAELLQFQAAAQNHMRSMEGEIRRTEQQLAEEEDKARREVVRCELALEEAQMALRACQAAAVAAAAAGMEVDCSGCRDAVYAAEAAVLRAKQELKDVQGWRSLLDKSKLDYQSRARQLAAFLNNELPVSTSLLDREAVSIERYVATRSGGTIFTAPKAASPGSSGAHHPEVERGGETEPVRESFDGTNRVREPTFKERWRNRERWGPGGERGG